MQADIPNRWHRRLTLLSVSVWLRNAQARRRRKGKSLDHPPHAAFQQNCTQYVKDLFTWAACKGSRGFMRRALEQFRQGLKGHPRHGAPDFLTQMYPRRRRQDLVRLATVLILHAKDNTTYQRGPIRHTRVGRTRAEKLFKKVRRDQKWLNNQGGCLSDPAQQDDLTMTPLDKAAVDLESKDRMLNVDCDLDFL